MKKGPVILVITGLALTAALVFSPVTPEVENAVANPNEAKAEDHDHADHDHTHEGNDHLSAVDQQVDSLLLKLQSGELPPMQAVMQIRDIAEEHPENLKAQFTLGLMSMQTGQTTLTRIVCKVERCWRWETLLMLQRVLIRPLD